MALIVVSNRLPVTVRHGPDGVVLSESVGGVATGMRSVMATTGDTWIGWPGPTDQLTPPEAETADRLLAARGCA
ncbi:MAG TPA: hypothetical protein VLD58_14210, partial [Gemmatimonadales bacterium]|nr:hypothetical protein [Gemmatimonadales bacterium]